MTINNDITLGSGLTLTLSGAGAIVGVSTPELTAGTVSLTQIDVFAATALFTFGAVGATGSLELITEADQDVHDWMIAADRNLTVTSAGTVFVRSAIGDGVVGRDLGAGDLTLVSTGGAVRILADIITTDGNITLNGNTGINLNGGGAKTFSGADITLIGDAQSNRDLTFTASGTLRVNNDITLTVMAAARALTLSGATEINFNGGGAKTLSGAAITLTGTTQSNRDLTLTASGTLRINSSITLTEAGALSLTSTGGLVRIFANISSDGNITLSGGTAGINLNGGTAKTISGAAIMLTGAARSNRNLTITATGVLTLNSDIIAGTRTLELSGSSITLGGALTLNGRFTTLTGAATGTADLTITASRNLRLNNSIDTGAGNLTLSGGTGSTGGGLNLNGGIAVGDVKTFSGADITLTGAARSNRDLTFTASGTLRINNDITVTGARALSLTSTGGDVRILADIITTGGDLTLNGSAGINLNGGGAKTFSGAAITLTGAARSNRDLTITAAGVLTINNNIDIGTRALTLEASAAPTFGAGAADLMAGEFTFTPDFSCTGSTTPRCTVNTP